MIRTLKNNIDFLRLIAKAYNWRLCIIRQYNRCVMINELIEIKLNKELRDLNISICQNK